MASKRQADHRRKRKVRIPKSSPFPVPIATLSYVPSKQNYWFYYTGELKDDYVTVSYSGDISFLYTMGFFGRGLLSRGAADFQRSLPDVYIPTQDGGTDILKVMRRRMYLRHKQWELRRGQSAEVTSTPTTVPEELQEFDSDVEYRDAQEQYEMQSNFSQIPQGYREQQNQDISTGKQSAGLADTDIDNETSVSDEGEPAAGEDAWKDTGEAGWDTAEADEDFWRVDDKDKKDSFDTWENTKPDCDFWGTEDNGEIEMEKESKVASKCLESEKLLEIESSKEDENKIYDRDSPPRKKIKVNDTKSPEGKNDVCDKIGTFSEVLQKYHKTRGVISDIRKDNDKCIKEQKDDGDKNVNFSNCINENSDIQNDKRDIVNDTISSERESDSGLENNTVELPHKTDIMHETSAVDLPQESDDKLENTAGDFPQEMIVDDADKEDVDMLDAHPSCVEEDTDGQYLVVDDSDCDDTITNVQIKRKNIWRPVKKADTYPYKEPLILSLEEAFFLSYGLGCLTVRDQTNSAMSLSDMWCQFSHMKQRFLPSYVAYHYFRSKGWVPRSGIIFGVDFIVYRVGPPFYHGSYSVIVKTVYEDDYQEVERYTNRKLTWTSFAGLNRITEHVAKSLMFCYVIMPKCLTDEQLRSPSCLSQFKVRLQVVNRWVSSQEREKDNEPEMP